ncbi:MAG: rhodanese-like domain-containing protein [Anaerolineales bacterium]|jgi:rhodanese-related sulfurtransferase
MKRHKIPETAVEELGEKLKTQERFVILDVRESVEIDKVSLEDERVCFAPMSRLAYSGIEALPEPARSKSAEIVVLCHHGVRSTEVTGWLLAQGWQKVSSLRGGIDAYALLVDPSLGRYY